MKILTNETALRETIVKIDKEMERLNDQKITALLDHLGLTERSDVPKDFLQWETILIVVPSRQVSHELKHYKFTINRIAFATNTNARQIHIYDFKDWKNAFRNKSQLQIRNLLKSSFGGVKNLPEDYLKIDTNTPK